MSAQIQYFYTVNETTKLEPHPAVRLAEERLRRHVGQHLSYARVWLFGSRARGNALRRSDFDLAFEPLDGFDDASLFAFEDAVQNDPEIIYPVDLVNLSEAGDLLRARIEQEGILWKS